MNRYFYSLWKERNGNQMIHILGNIYDNDDETEECYRIAECVGLDIELTKGKQMCSEPTNIVFEDFVQEKVGYLGDITEAEANELCRTYFNGNPGTELLITNITDDTPCGDYWFDQK